MGSIISRDPYLQLIKKPEPVNSFPIVKYQQSEIFMNVKFKAFQIVYDSENEDEIERVYKFGEHRIYIRVTKKQEWLFNDQTKEQAENKLLYGYKLTLQDELLSEKNEKIENKTENNEQKISESMFPLHRISMRPQKGRSKNQSNNYFKNIKEKFSQQRYEKTDTKINNDVKQTKSILVKARIYGQKEKILNYIAELKYFSYLQIGPYFGCMIDNADAHITSSYIQYFTEPLKQSDFQDQQFENNLLSYCLIQIPFKSIKRGFSKIFSVVVVRPRINQTIYQLDLKSLRDVEQLIMKIDKSTFQISSMQNAIFQKNLPETIKAFYQVMNNISKPYKLNFIQYFVDLAKDIFWLKQHTLLLIKQTMEDQSLLKKADKKVLSILEKAKLQIEFKDKVFSSQAEIDDYSHQHTNSWDQNSARKSKLKVNIQDNNNERSREIIRQIIQSEIKENSQSHFQKEEDNNQPNINNKIIIDNVSFDYAVLLMKSGKSRLALSIFEVLLRSTKVHDSLKYKIYLFVGLIYYHRQYYQLAVEQWNSSINVMNRIYYYSPKMVLIFNNIACTLYQMEKYQKAIDLVQYAEGLSYDNYQINLLLLNNKCIIYMKLLSKNKQNKAILKKFKGFYNVLMNVKEPINKAILHYKMLSNYGYEKLLNQNYYEAIAIFNKAISLQKDLLVKNGFKISPFLHNNMAMAKFKMNSPKSALDYLSPYLGDFENLKGIEGLKLNYNIAIINKAGYHPNVALLYLQKCKYILSGLRGVPISVLLQYKKKLDSEIEWIKKNNIIQEEQNQSEVAILSSLSKRLNQ